MSSVKFTHSGMTNAPVLNGTVGSLIALLDACLVNGFSSQTVDSLVIASNVATVTRAAGHPFEIGSVVEISGATVSGGGTVNGQFIVLSTTTTQYTFATTGVSNQTATGTITHRVAPLGWGKTFSGTNLAVYRSADVTGTRSYLRVDDTNATDSRVVGYETMSDINTGTGIFPTAAQQSGGLFWTKAQTSGTTARPWMIVGDSRLFYLAIAHGSTAGYNIAAFGDINSNKSPDPYGCMITGFSVSRTNTGTGGNSTDDFAQLHSGTSYSNFIARASSGLGSSAVFRKSIPGMISSDNYFSGAGGVAFPNPADNGLHLSPVYLGEVSPAAYRGIAPGFFASFQAIGASVYAAREYVSGVNSYAGRTFRAIPNNTGVSFVDITGPWR